jgi:hypothetical protein
MRTRSGHINFILIIMAVGLALFVAACGNKRSSRKGISPAVALAPVKRELTPLPVRPLSPCSGEFAPPHYGGCGGDARVELAKRCGDD